MEKKRSPMIGINYDKPGGEARIINRHEKPAASGVWCRKETIRGQAVRRVPIGKISFLSADLGWTKERNRGPLPLPFSGFRDQSDLPAWVFSLDLPFEPAKT